MKLIVLLTLLFFSDLALTAQDADLSIMKDTSTTGSMDEIQRKNVFSLEQYSLAAVQLAKNSMMQYAHGTDCQGSCPLGCCDSGDGLMFESGLFTMLNQASNTQAAEHRLSALQACAAYNKLSSSQKNCAAEISELSHFTPQASWYDDKGRCSSNAPKECKIMEGLNVSPFQNIGSQGCTGTQSTSCSKKFFEDIKLNPDGSINLKTSTGIKKVTLQDFADQKSLIKLGLSADIAKSLSQKYSQNTAQLKLTMLTRPSQYNDRPTHAEASLSENQQNQTLQQTVSDTEVSSTETGVRRPSTADLHLRLGDDPVGRPDDDIFNMIQKRYLANDQKDLFN